jgi:hypothetical protein
VLNVWVAPRDKPNDARPVTNDRNRGIRGFSFAYTGNHILYAQDVGGDENFEIFVTDLTSGETRALSPKGARVDRADQPPLSERAHHQPQPARSALF